MKKLLAAALLFFAGCGPDAWQATVADDAAPLTSAPGDRLFVLKVVHAPAPVKIFDVKVSAALPGQTQVTLNFTFDDSNGDDLLSDNDSLICNEGPVALFDQGTVGKQVEVLLLQSLGGSKLSQLAKLSWTPAN